MCTLEVELAKFADNYIWRWEKLVGQVWPMSDRLPTRNLKRNMLAVKVEAVNFLFISTVLKQV